MNQDKMQAIFQKHQLDVIVSTSQQTRLWYTNIDISYGFLFIEKSNAATLFVDGRYFEMASHLAKNAQVKLLNPQLIEEFCTKNTKKYQKIGIEADYLTVKEFENCKKMWPNAHFILISGQKLREIKSGAEIELISEAAQISLKALEKLKPEIKPGVSEKFLEHKLEMYLKECGAQKSAFDIIIASGKRSSLPHGRASEKILNNNEFVTIDFGALHKGYAADITRTLHVGTVSDKKLLEIEQILIKAQKSGIEAIKPGVKAAEIDKICRDYIHSKGYGEYFVHSTGHGLGIDVHELPIVSSKSDDTLEPGMVITVEPGIYIPDVGGIRIEDDILVTENGYKILSKLTN